MAEGKEEEEGDKPSSPLFDDFSDDDFDEMQQRSRTGSQPVAGGRGGRVKEEVIKNEECSGQAVAVCAEILGLEREEGEGGGSNISSLSTLDSPTAVPSPVSHDQLKDSVDTPVTSSSPPPPPPPSSPPPPPSCPIEKQTIPLTTTVEGELETLDGQVSEEGNREEVEMELSSPQPPSEQRLMASPTPPPPQSDFPMAELSMSEDPVDKLPCDVLDLASKPAGKRKMSLLEYRSRVKRPGAAEGKKSGLVIAASVERHPTSLPSVTSSVSFPSVSFLSFSSSFLSGSSRLGTSHAPPPSTSTGEPHASPFVSFIDG